MPDPRSLLCAAAFALAGVAAMILAPVGCAGRPAPTPPSAEVYSEVYGPVIEDRRSDYSHIRVRQKGRIRTLLFVEPSGEEFRQSALHLDAPGRLLLPYTRYLLATRILRHPQERVLIVGLGGGSMTRFINHHFSETRVDAVEIDPEVVRIAGQLFGTRAGPKTVIHTEDAFAFLEKTAGRYDVIYMDAFLEPSTATDLEGVPLHLKTVRFLRSLHGKLEPGGLVAFNLILSDDTARDLAAIRAAFPNVYVFEVPITHNLAVIATPSTRRVSSSSLRQAAGALDRRYDVGFSFEALLDRFREE